MDLLLTNRIATPNIPISYQWVKGHSDTEQWCTIADLQSQQLSRDQIYNIWCDKMAKQSWTIGSPTVSDPAVTPEEQWAVYASFPSFHKLTGNLSGALHTYAIQQYLSKLHIFKRVTLIKLIHGWNPTLAILCHQGRALSSVCSRCNTTTETIDHIIQCPNLLAIDNRISCLRNFIQRLSHYRTPRFILQTFQYKLSLTLHIPLDSYSLVTHTSYEKIPEILLRAIRHQISPRIYLNLLATILRVLV
jgi:hypothetical protein